jgi:putative ABC transport system permease protein
MIPILLKGLWHRKIQNLALVISIVVGVSLIFSVLLIRYGVEDGLEKARQRLGADLLVVPSGTTVDPGEILYGGSPNNIYMPKQFEEKISQIQGIRKVTAQFFTQSLTDDCCDIGTAIRLIGYDPKTDWIIQPWLNNISKIQLADDEVILGANVPTSLTDKINILGKTFHITATLEPSGTGLDRSILMDINVARNIAVSSTNLQQIWNANGPPSELISAILIEVESNTDIDAIISQIENTGKVHAFSAAETKRRIYEQFLVITSLLIAAGSMAVVASAVQLFSRLYTLTIERQGEWGLYLALGSTPPNIVLLIVAEAVILCSIGTIIGMVFGYLLFLWSVGFITDHQIFPFIYPDFFLVFKTGLVIFFAWIAVGSVAAWIPAYRSSRIEPSLIMTRGEFD